YIPIHARRFFWPGIHFSGLIVDLRQQGVCLRRSTMKKVVATILSLSVLVAGSALATPPPVPSAPPVAAAGVSPQAAAVPSTAASTQALRAPSAQHPHRGHGHRFDRAGHRHGPG